ncbi:MAG: hypothetical protein PHU21_12875 [Elusimicrobia bacterium]|nr:hypothetical protein [Elusimicrobiota bacterium]
MGLGALGYNIWAGEEAKKQARDDAAAAAQAQAKAAAKQEQILREKPKLVPGAQPIKQPAPAGGMQGNIKTGMGLGAPQLSMPGLTANLGGSSLSLPALAAGYGMMGLKAKLGS